MDVVATSARRSLKRLRLSRSVIGRFTFRYSVLSAILLAAVLSVFICSRAVLFHESYGTVEEQTEFIALVENNVGPRILFTTPHHIDTVGGYVAWNALSIASLAGAIWALLISTKFFRGEEEAGHSELLLAGQTTSQRAALQALFGLGASLLIVFFILAIPFIHVSNLDTVGIPQDSALFFVAAIVASMAMFVAVGALASQIMPTRARALSLGAGFLGLAYLLRALADVASIPWLHNFTPLGWIINLHPLYDNQPVWFMPIVIFTLSLCALTVRLVGWRDLNASVVTEKDTSVARTALLNTSFLAAFRLSCSVAASWLVVIGGMAALFGFLTDTAVQAFRANSGAEELIGRVSGASWAATSAAAFLGVAFLLLITLGMFYVAAAINRIRIEESEGYLDNLLVRPVGRVKWLLNQTIIIVFVIYAAGLLAGSVAWLSAKIMGVDLSFGDLMAAGINFTAPAVLLLGIGIAVFGLMPRRASLVVFGLATWSFFVTAIGSNGGLNHWLADTSLLQHVALAPAVAPRWGTVAIYIGLGIALCGLGFYAFNHRDIDKDN